MIVYFTFDCLEFLFSFSPLFSKTLFSPNINSIILNLLIFRCDFNLVFFFKWKRKFIEFSIKSIRLLFYFWTQMLGKWSVYAPNFRRWNWISWDTIRWCHISYVLYNYSNWSVWLMIWQKVWCQNIRNERWCWAFCYFINHSIGTLLPFILHHVNFFTKIKLHKEYQFGKFHLEVMKIKSDMDSIALLERIF